MTAEVARAVAGALVDSLWQGALVLAGYVGWARALRRAAPPWRAGAATATIAVLCSLPVLNLVAPRLGGAALELPAARMLAGVGAGEQVAALTPGWAEVGVAIWAAGVALWLARIAAGLTGIRRMLRGATPLELAQLAPLARAAGLPRAPGAWQVAAGGAPCIVGWRRPALLVPAGLAEMLPPDELEAILRHELAHLQRRDFAVHLALRIAAALAWHQPALRWLFARLGHERELCCDDLAVRAGGEPMALARALVALEEHRQPAAALIAAGTGGAVRDRVLRLLAAAGEAPRADMDRAEVPAVRAGLEPQAGAPPCIPVDRALAPRRPAARRRRHGEVAGLGGAALMMLATLAAVVAGLPAARAPAAARYVIRARDPAGPFTVEMVGERLVAASIAGQVVPAARIVQDGRQVRLLGASGDVALALDITASGGIHWDARPLAGE